MKHPLLNPNAVQYQKNGKQTIEEIEKKMSLDHLIGACLFNINKYIGREKGQNDLDAEKVEDYQRYLRFLLDVKNRAIDELEEIKPLFFEPILVIYKKLKIEIEYEL
ncbi:MAG: DUF3310 domain-containing protein [Sulfurovaceae bacterium]